MPDWFSIIIFFLSNWYLLLASFMVGSVVVRARGWAKLRKGKNWIDFWSVVEYLFAETILITLSLIFLAPYVNNWLMSHLQYVLGVTAFMMGTFFLWIVYTGDYGISKHKKWVFPTVCYLISAANILIINI